MPVAPSSYRRRIRRGQAIEGPQGFWSTLFERASRAEVVVRLGLCLGAALVMALLVRGWMEPFPWHVGAVAPRGVAARVPFKKPDAERTREARKRAEAQVRVVYTQDKAKLMRLRDGLKNRLAELAPAETLAAVPRAVWLEFAPEAADAFERLPPPAAPGVEQPTSPADDQPSRDVAVPIDEAVLAAEQEYQRFRGRVASKEKQTEVDRAIDRAFAEILGTGVLEKLQHDINEGSQTEIDVYPLGNPADISRVQVFDVQLVEAKLRLAGRFTEEFGEGPVTSRLVGWLEQRLAGSLEVDLEGTAKAKKKASDETPQQFERYAAGDLLAPPGAPLSPEQFELLELEERAFNEEQTVPQRLSRLVATFGLLVAVLTLAGFYIHLRHHDILDDLGHVATLLGLSTVTVLVCLCAAADGWRAETVPLVVFALTVAIAYEEDLALLLAAEVALVVVVVLGAGMSSFVTLVSTAAAVVFWTGRLRSRSRLIYVGLFAAAVAFFTQIGSQLLESRPLDKDYLILTDAARTAGWVALSGFLMTGLLPFIERAFGVLTDLSLLEVGDIAHPLLQELVRRAPGTYNHSINVASIGEAAAEAIGARGLLVRVGAYFHDVGKMLKPAYFVENQGQQPSLHETLAPAMSTLVIVAHVKEGAELARQYHLPQPIVDLITEHHGTTLVEYFFRRATERSQVDPNGTEVDEQMYRYPGPKPSTRESAVLMLADATESASRALADPTPARIQGLVHDLAMKRLLDGQFEDCGLTLEELARIEDSLTKSLTAVYHGRVKYPGQRSK